MPFKDLFGKFLPKSRSSSTKSRGKRKSSEQTSTFDKSVNAEGSFKQHSKIHNDAVMCSAAVSNGICLCGAKDEIVSLFDFENGCTVQKWHVHEKEITKVVYGQRANAFFSASRDRRVAMLVSGSSEAQRLFTGHDMVVTGLDINTDNTRICTGSRDNTLRLWDVQSGVCLLKNSITRNLVSHVDWAEDSDLIAQCGEDKELRLLDARTLQVSHSFAKKQYIQTCCQISEDRNYCVSSSNGFGGSGCEATLWDLRTGAIVHEFKGHYETCNYVRFVPMSVTEGRSLIMTCSNDSSIRVWDQNTQECLCCVDIPSSGPLTSLALFNDSRLCATSFALGVQVLRLEVKSGLVSLKRIAAF